MSLVGVFQRIIRSLSLPRQTLQSMLTSMLRSWTSSQSMTKSSPYPCPCTSVSCGKRAGTRENINILQELFLIVFICRIWTNNTIEPGFWYPVSLEFLNDLWIPNVFIYNLKSFSSLQVLKRLAGML